MLLLKFLFVCYMEVQKIREKKSNVGKVRKERGKIMKRKVRKARA
jgi:hypothetical protein